VFYSLSFSYIWHFFPFTHTFCIFPDEMYSLEGSRTRSPCAGAERRGGGNAIHVSFCFFFILPRFRKKTPPLFFFSLFIFALPLYIKSRAVNVCFPIVRRMCFLHLFPLSLCFSADSWYCGVDARVKEVPHDLAFLVLFFFYGEHRIIIEPYLKAGICVTKYP
jgi:hypothetical protein